MASWMRPEDEEDESAVSGSPMARLLAMSMRARPARSYEEYQKNKRIDQDQRDFSNPSNFRQQQPQRYSDPRASPISDGVESVLNGIGDAAMGVKGVYDYFVGDDEPEPPAGWHPPQALPVARGMPLAHAKALPASLSGAFDSPASSPDMPPPSWHPPMVWPPKQAPTAAAPRKPVMPNTPRDPDKDRRRDEAMKALLSGQTGKSPNSSPAASVHPSQDPFGLAAPKPQMSVSDPNAVQASVDEMAQASGGNGMGNINPAADLRDRLLDKAFAPKDDGAESLREQKLLGFQRDAGRQSNNLGFMKLLMRNANQAGTLAGKSASSQPFDDYVGGLEQENQRSADLATKLATKKSGSSGTEKILMSLLKMDQDANLRREGFKVQRESNDSRNKLSEAQLDAMNGYHTGQLGLREKEIEGLGTFRGSQTELDRKRLEESERHNKAIEDAAKKKADKKDKEKPVSQGAAEADMFRKRMESANTRYEDYTRRNPSFDPTNTKDALMGAVPFVGNGLTSKDAQMLKQYEVEFVRANLRDESGATIGDKEAYEQAASFFPRWGDSKEKIAEKSRARKNLIQAMRESYQAQTGRGAQDAPGAGPLKAPLGDGKRIIESADDL